MKVIEIVESLQYRNVTNGATVSFYGAHPNSVRKDEWIVESRGWSFRWDNGTIAAGGGRMPFKTKEDAQEALQQMPNVFR